jgi:outer membrane protein OmpA-like peptidoglycan-associated protein
MIANIGKIVIGLLVGMIFLFGCTQTQLNVKPIAKTEHPAALLETLRQELTDARKDRVNLLSPNWYQDAEDSYANAKAGLDKGSDLSGILHHIATGQAQLAQAVIFTGKSNKYLSDVIKSRDAAAKAGANRYKKEYAELESGFTKLTEAIEKGDTGYVRKKKESVDNAYRELELRAIKDAALVDVRRLMNTAETLEMDETAPKSYLTAKSKQADAEAVITKNRYDKEAIDSAVEAAEFYGRRLHQIAGTVEKVDQMEPEEIVLWMELFLAQTSTQLKQSDRRNLSFKDQQEVILSAITSLQRNSSSVSSQVLAKNLEIDKLNKRIKDLEGRTYEVRADKERLAAEKQFNELYSKVQGYFSPDQAEVYKKSKHLVIRLKAIQFPVGQAVILPSNYPLLTTVQKAIRAFGKPDVVIEGHTDSTGSEALNKELSRKRAESVQQYLIHNLVLPAEKVMARGYGSSRPLASNATAPGRAINRRIDVIIKPERK